MRTAAYVHVWPWPILRGDYLRGAAGFAVTGVPLAFVERTPVTVVLLGGLAALFAWLLTRTWRRHRARIETDEEGIRWNRRVLAWPALKRVSARRFGAHRRDGGYVEMTLSGAGTRLTLDSQLTDAIILFRFVACATESNGLMLDDRTRAAFGALGLQMAVNGRAGSRPSP